MSEVAEAINPPTGSVMADDPGSWLMSTVQRRSMPAGELLSDLPGPRWILVIDGAVTLETADGRQRLGPQDAALIAARTAHRISAIETTELVVSDLRAAVPAGRLPSPLIVRDFGLHHHGVAALVTACPLTDACRPSLFAASYGGLIGASMASSWIDDRDQDQQPDHTVAAVLTAITERPAEPWTVDRMAGVVHLSRSALGERFRRTVGRGPAEVLRDVRMQAARQLLVDGAHPIEYVAGRVGYGSTAAFSRAFSAHHGIAPQAWRDHARGSAPGTRRAAKISPARTAEAAPTSMATVTL